MKESLRLLRGHNLLLKRGDVANAAIIRKRIEERDRRLGRGSCPKDLSDLKPLVYGQKLYGGTWLKST